MKTIQRKRASSDVTGSSNATATIQLFSEWSWELCVTEVAKLRMQIRNLMVWCFMLRCSATLQNVLRQIWLIHLTSHLPWQRPFNAFKKPSTLSSRKIQSLSGEVARFLFRRFSRAVSLIAILQCSVTKPQPISFLILSWDFLQQVTISFNNKVPLFVSSIWLNTLLIKETKMHLLRYKRVWCTFWIVSTSPSSSTLQ